MGPWSHCNPRIQEQRQKSGWALRVYLENESLEKVNVHTKEWAQAGPEGVAGGNNREPFLGSF